MEKLEKLKTVKFYSGDLTPLEMHKVRVVQKLNLLPVEEPPVLRFFVGKLKPIGDWVDKLVAKFRHDFGDSL